MYNIIKLDYYDDFRCLCDKCKKSCCDANWDIPMSKGEYLRLKASNYSPEVTEILKTSLKRNKDKETSSDLRYASFKLVDGVCPLYSDGFCALQKSGGEKALTDVCRVFPRKGTRFGDILIKSCYLACEAVPMELMKHKNGINLIFSESDFEPDAKKDYFATQLDLKNIKGSVQEFYMDFLTLAFAVLQKREISFSSRLILLGMAFREIQEKFETKDMTQTSNIVDKYTKYVITDEIKSVLDSFKLDLTKSKDIFFGLINGCIPTNPSLRASIITKKLIEESPVIEENLRATEINMKKLDEYLSQNPIYIENFMLNAFVSLFFPYKIPFVTVWDNYIAFCGIYSSYMMSLISMSENGMNDELFIDTTADFFRAFTHNDKTLKNILDLYKLNSLDNLPSLATIIQFF